MKAKIVKANSIDEFYTNERCFIKELWNLEDDCLSIASARVEPGVTTVWHYLKGVDERYIIISGEGVVEIGDLPATKVRKGDVVNIPAGVQQRVRNISDTDLVFYCVCTPRFTPESYNDIELD